MSPLSHRTYPAPSLPGNLSELLLRDVAALLLTSELISSSLIALRPECETSEALTAALDAMINLCDEGNARLQPPLLESGLVLPTTTDTSASTLITGFFTRLPPADDPQFTAEVMLNLQLLAQHVELKARLAGEEAMIVGLDELGQALANWSGEWRACGHRMRMNVISSQKRDPTAPLHSRIVAFAIPQAG